MNRAHFVLASLVLAVPLHAVAGEPRSLQLGDLAVKVSITPDPPRTGENRLEISLADATGRPVDGAKLGFIWDMPAMGAMPEMRGNGTIEPRGGGRYLVSYPLSMEGDWYLALGIDAPGHTHQEVKMKVATTRPGLTVEDAGGGGGHTIVVSAERRQLIGVTFGVVERRPLALTLRAAGRVEIDERNLADVTLKYEAYVQKLFVGETGKAVRRGQPLAVVYSPDLLAAEEELLAARRAGGSAALASGLERRLTYWDLSVAQREAVERAGKADGRVTISAPAGGVVMEKNVVEGGAGRGRDVALPHRQPRARLDSVRRLRARRRLPVGGTAGARAGAVAPRAARSARDVRGADGRPEDAHHRGARLELKNPELALKPGMFADVVIEAPLGTRLAVPDSALLVSGEHRYAFVARGGGRLEPVEVEVGAQAANYTEVRRGLSPGDRVATGATFLLSSEAKLRDALPRWRTP